ncbi:hypothetical protein Hgul01_05391 [Herpetosiphon gulosus]|uniref:Uncharacterized protein n=1 Tax=Herpetosiphon gulosus TaxID=1973496 RepID=A0ABP9XAS2_9CHLR
MVLGILGLAGIGFLRVLPTLLGVPDNYDFRAYYLAGEVLNTHGNIYDDGAMAAAAATKGIPTFPRY